MVIWVDAQLSPALAPWPTENFQVEAYSVKYLGLRDATDDEIFRCGQLRLVEKRGAPPQVLLLTLGNTSNGKVRSVLSALFHEAELLLSSGDAVVEIGDAP
jgi:predicted nuclease of predicted toxin-antitoxin system